MSGKRRKYMPEIREQGARLVLKTGRPVATVAADTGVGSRCWLGGFAWNETALVVGILSPCSMPMTRQVAAVAP